jgi:hypothetical protein
MEGKTLTGVNYRYNGSLEDGLEVFKGSPSFKVSKELIDLIKSEIERKSPVLMGACRDNPNPYSIGRFLLDEGYSPQNLSYVIPLLIDEGFCEASEKKPFTITHTNKTLK